MNGTIYQSEVALEKYRSTRGFASRMCLILKRYLEIPGYATQVPEPLEQALAFFKVAVGKAAQDVSIRPFDRELVNLHLVRQVLDVAGEMGDIPRSIDDRQFCDLAISTLATMISVPKRADKKNITMVHDFFCTTEKVVDRDLTKLQRSAYSHTLAV